MSKIKRYSAAEKLAILQEIEMGQTTILGIVQKYNIIKTSLKEWRDRYILYGYDGLKIRTHNKKYSAELKLQAIQDYLSGNYSQYQIIGKYPHPPLLYGINCCFNGFNDFFRSFERYKMAYVRQIFDFHIRKKVLWIIGPFQC